MRKFEINTYLLTYLLSLHASDAIDLAQKLKPGITVELDYLVTHNSNAFLVYLNFN